MRRGVSDSTGNTVGTIGDECAIGQAMRNVVDDSAGKMDTRPPEDRVGTITITLPLASAHWVAGHRVAIFPIEE